MNIAAYDTRTEASAAAAELLGKQLSAVLEQEERAILMASGGRSPVDTLSLLSKAPLDWQRVLVTLTDERQVPVTDELSNEKMVLDTLMNHDAQQAHFLPLESPNVALIRDQKPVTLVGMGEDGHFASIFPDLPERLRLLDLDEPPGCFEVVTIASPVPRITANLSLLLQSRLLLLLIFGAKKRDVLLKQTGLPIHDLVRASGDRLQILWAP